MAKQIYLNFENDRVVLISLNMSTEHLAVYCDRFNLDIDALIDMRDNDKIKSVYVNLDSEHIIGFKDKNNKIVYSSYYYQFIIQNFKQSFLFELKPLGTPKLPKARKQKIIVEKSQPIIKEILQEVVQEVVDIKALEEELQICLENEDYERAAKVRDKINSVK